MISVIRSERAKKATIAVCCRQFARARAHRKVADCERAMRALAHPQTRMRSIALTSRNRSVRANGRAGGCLHLFCTFDLATATMSDGELIREHADAHADARALALSHSFARLRAALSTNLGFFSVCLRSISKVFVVLV